MNNLLKTFYKNTDNEGTLHLGKKYSDKQWKLNEYENDCILLVPIIQATTEEANATFDVVFSKHKKNKGCFKVKKSYDN